MRILFLSIAVCFGFLNMSLAQTSESSVDEECVEFQEIIMDLQRDKFKVQAAAGLEAYPACHGRDIFNSIMDSYCDIEIRLRTITEMYIERCETEKHRLLD